jgi:adenine-specific DNA methylase
MELMQDASKEKLRGGFYTPQPIVNFILKWLQSNNVNGDILEPSCGDGNFLEGLSQMKFNSVTAIEYDSDEYEKSLKRSPRDFFILNEDFHAYCNSTAQKFDAIIGNPPYIRYQYFDKEQREEAIKIFEKSGVKYSKLMNAWVSFVVGSTQLLKENGKIAFVLPAEILQVGYARTLRQFLLKSFKKISVLTFKKLVFDNIQQEVVILFCDKNGTSKTKIDHFEVADLFELEEFDVSKVNKPSKRVFKSDSKWTHYFLSRKEVEFLEEVKQLNDVKNLGSYCKVEVGITTGANPFFTVSKEVVEEYDLLEYAFPMVGRSVQVPSIILKKKDWLINVNNGSRAYFLLFPTYEELNSGAKEYINYAEVNNKYHKGYKCRIRDEWYRVPSTSLSDGLFIRRNNIFPRLIENKISAYTTDTMHRVWVKGNVKLLSVIGSYYNSLSLGQAELQGRSHGGGVLELMPNETESILLPYSDSNSEYVAYIDKMFRKGKGILDILEVMNEIILKNQLGFSNSEIALCESIRCKLLGRRMSRGGKKKY